MIKQASFALVLSALALGALGCSTDHGMNGDPDAGIQLPDSARPPDAVFYDGGPTSGNIGAACTADTDCGAMGQCIEDPQLFPGGYCTATCDASMADTCPAGSQCQDFGGGQMFCVLTCDSGSMARQCLNRPGYGCSTSVQLSGVCVGGCVDASDCPAGLMCDQMGGDLGAGGCFTPGATIGAACMDDTQCPSGAACQPENGGGWPGGACIAGGCDLAGNTGCSGDAQCVALNTGFGPPQGFCIDGCSTTADCRAGYACTPSSANPDRHYCAPQCTSNSQCSGGNVCNVGLGTCGPAFAGTIGGTCSRRDPSTCAGGTCLSERSSGFPGMQGYCSYSGCGASQPCPTGGVCTARPGAVSLCLRACTGDTDCNTAAGYACRHSDPADTSSAMACVPACTMTAQCTSMGDVCNVGTGTCAQPFMAANEGIACTSDAACVGGRCMTESAFGYPSGECVVPGCSLTTGVMGATCPGASTCVDDAIGSPDLGICAPTCTVGGTTCRAGYACVAIAGSATMGACQPACTPTSCATGRTCNTTTGHCM
jgi:hypothetical protein